MNLKKNKKPQGFTLMEMLVVVIIIALVSVIGTNTYQGQREQVRYNNSVAKVLSLIKTARNYAISSRSVFDENKPPGEESYIPKEGYGVYLERTDNPGESRVVLFANTQADDPDGIEKVQYDPGQDLVEEEYILDAGTHFAGLWVDHQMPFTGIGGADPDKAVVIFKPPIAETSMAVNDHPAPENLTELTDLYLEFRRQEANEALPSQFIHINKISGLAEVIR